MKKFILCYVLRYHAWTWKLSSVGNKLVLNSPIPGHAICERCGLRYAEGKVVSRYVLTLLCFVLGMVVGWYLHKVFI